MATLDARFREAVTAIDGGEAAWLGSLLRASPDLVQQRLETPGPWLRSKVGDALDGYFARPYLLWFVAGNPKRQERLPTNIAVLASTIVDAAKQTRVETLREQLDTTLGLLVTGSVARDSGIQHWLIDVLVNAGASVDGLPLLALIARNPVAAKRLVERGAEMTLAAALCLRRPVEAEQLARTATPKDRQIALAAAAINGNVEALRQLVELGVELDEYGEGVRTHATALHDAVEAGSLPAVQLLVQAGANPSATDRIHRTTPLAWAERLGHRGIAEFLRRRSAVAVPAAGESSPADESPAQRPESVG